MFSLFTRWRLTGSMNLYSLTVNYRHHIDRIKGSPFGLYGVVGGGWITGHGEIDKGLSGAA